MSIRWSGKIDDKDNIGKFNGHEMFLLPVPPDEMLDKLDEEACNYSAFWSMQSMLDVLKSIPTKSGFDFPYNTELLESLYPQKSHAKPLRESLTYYMLAHLFNELMPPATISILRIHKIPYNYKVQ